jgi:predicted enzyme related to lactoylglutathione lyase
MVVRRFPPAVHPIRMDDGDEALMEVGILAQQRPFVAMNPHAELSGGRPRVVVEDHDLVVGVVAPKTKCHGGGFLRAPMPQAGGRVVVYTGDMTDFHVEITDVTVDCADPERVASFWSALLGRPIAGRKGPYVWLVRAPGGIGLGFQHVSENKTGKNRVHIDVSGPDVAEIKRRVETLGGRRADGYDAGGFLVMSDPEGNEFCIVPETLHFDDSGRADYLDEVDL